MKQISNKEYEKYQQYQTDKLHSRILTPDGLRVICAGLIVAAFGPAQPSKVEPFLKVKVRRPSA